MLKIFLVIWYASIPRHRPKTSGRNIWPVASNLTYEIHCVVMFPPYRVLDSWNWKTSTYNLKANLYVGQHYLCDNFRNNCNSASSICRPLTTNNTFHESGSFRPWVVSAGTFRPGSFRPIFGVGRFGLRRWVVSALGRFGRESFRPNLNRDRIG